VHFFDFLRWWPSAVLDLFDASLDHPQRVLSPYHLVHLTMSLTSLETSSMKLIEQTDL